MANEMGKRYACGSCGSEMLVTKGGKGALACCGTPMQIKVAAPKAKQPENKA